MALFILTFLALSLVESQSTLINMKCGPVLGIVGQNTTINCTFEKNFIEQDIIIQDIRLKRKRKDDCTCVVFDNDFRSEDPRFMWPNKRDPSLLLTNTRGSDEGEYYCDIKTNRGIVENVEIKLNVTGEYNDPVISSVPEKVEDGRHVVFYCNANGGYRKGSIYWYDGSNRNWTEKATTNDTVGDDKLVNLFSNLTFEQLDSSLTRIKCCVVNSEDFKEKCSPFKDVLTGAEPSIGSTVEASDGGHLQYILGLVGFLVLMVAVMFYLYQRWKQNAVNRKGAPAEGLLNT